jgi:hypothetical protein
MRTMKRSRRRRTRTRTISMMRTMRNSTSDHA